MDLIGELSAVMTDADYKAAGHQFVPWTTSGVVGCVEMCINAHCNCWKGSQMSLNLCRTGHCTPGGYLDSKSELRRGLEQRVGQRFGVNLDAWRQLYGK